MRKKLILLLLLALVLVIMLVLRGGENDGNGADVADRQQMQGVSDEAQHTGVSLSEMAANENGGVTITVAAEDGTSRVCTFTDVAIDSWYADAVNYVVTTGVMSGDEEQKLFQPEYGVARAQFAVIVCRFAGGEPSGGTVSFSDLTGEEWYYKYVSWMAEQKLMGGTDGGAFDPEGFLSCEQALIVLYRLAGEPTVKGTLESYPYAPKVSDSGRDAVTWAWNSGLITEQECVWYPTQAVSRAQVALLLMRYDSLIGRTTE